MTEPALEIAPAESSDLPAILEIQNREIREGVALWNETPKTLEQLADWRAQRLEAGFAVLAARCDGGLAGYGAYGPFRPHECYRDTVEHSLYVAPDRQGRGVGRALLAALEREARARGVWVMIGGIEAGNAASIALHQKLGFRETARMPEVAAKFGRRLTLVLMQKNLGSAGQSAS